MLIPLFQSLLFSVQILLPVQLIYSLLLRHDDRVYIAILWRDILLNLRLAAVITLVVRTPQSENPSDILIHILQFPQVIDCIHLLQPLHVHCVPFHDWRITNLPESRFPSFNWVVLHHFLLNPGNALRPLSLPQLMLTQNSLLLALLQ